MLLVLAGPYDPRGPVLCQRWASTGARLMTPADLQRPGWRHEPARPMYGSAVASGEPLAVADITGVCSLLPCVLDSDLPAIRAEDRSYVAAEMTAFLCAWLSALPCAVLNHPSPSCLCGPPWAPQRWRHAAAQAGLAATGPGSGDSVEVTVVGPHAFGGASETQAEVATRLAEVTHVPLLRVFLNGSESSPSVAGADFWLRPDHDGVADAIADLLLAQQ